MIAPRGDRPGASAQALRRGSEQEDEIVVDEAVYERLLAAARVQETVFYGEVAQLLGVQSEDPSGSGEVAERLAEISRQEVGEGRPMLSSIVVRVEDHLPGPELMRLGRELNQVAEGEDEVGFAVRQIKMVHAYWQEKPVFGSEAETAI
jgi:hypothetical protein